MKRLKYYLLQIDKDKKDNGTYRSIYDGDAMIFYPESIAPEPTSDNTYWLHEEISLTVSHTHKLAYDRPTLTWTIPVKLLGIEQVTDAAADFCLRRFSRYLDQLNAELYNRRRPDYENGKYYIGETGGEVLKRNSAYFAVIPCKDYRNGGGVSMYALHDSEHKPPVMCLCLKMQVQLPRKNLKKTMLMLCRNLPGAVGRFAADFDRGEFDKAMELARKQRLIRKWLKNSGYCAFIANGSILPRAKNTDLPMENAVPFKSTPNDEIEVCGVKGMGIRKGVTVITGGGYSGKSTLLDAIARGIYDHILGDGRELCITDNTAVTVSAEDGRSVKHINISPFIKWLPAGDTSDFSTEHASGSTSQAANIIEAADYGAKLLLIDEDRSATNFMIRDKMMKALIEKEPITPFTDRVQELYKSRGVSTILVIGGSGEYLSVADKIYMMEDYVIHDVTEKAKGICGDGNVQLQPPEKASWEQGRMLRAEGFSSYPENSGSEKLQVSDTGFILIGDEKVDVRGLHDIVSPRQLDTLGFMLRYLEVTNADSRIDIRARVEEMYQRIEKEGLDFLYSAYFTQCGRFLDMPRKQEMYALICRMRKIAFDKIK